MSELVLQFGLDFVRFWKYVKRPPTSKHLMSLILFVAFTAVKWGFLIIRFAWCQSSSSSAVCVVDVGLGGGLCFLLC